MDIKNLTDMLTLQIENLTNGLKKHQLEDGGFKGYHLFDKTSGIWSTCEVLHILLKVNPKLIAEDWIIKASHYIASLQNENGGWGFRGNGKSVVDVTAWACLALNHFGYEKEVKKGIEFLLSSRTNTIEQDKGGWGLTTHEPDRIYSSWIATNCLKRILSDRNNWFDADGKEKIYSAIRVSNAWIIKSKNPDGGWGALGDENSVTTSTAIALINSFSQGEDPRNYSSSYQYLKEKSENGLWPMETEVVVTQEGYELSQEWFSSVYSLRAFIFYAELGICPLSELHYKLISHLDLIDKDSVRPAKEASSNLIWPIPFMIELLHKYLNFISFKRKEYEDFLYQQEIEEKKRKKEEMENQLKTLFPYPISQVYFSYYHEIDYHRRFQYLVQLYEVIIKYTAIIFLSATIASNERIPALKELVSKRFRKPSLGDFASLVEIIISESTKVNNIFSPSEKNSITGKQINYLDKQAPKLNLNQVLSEIVSLRNKWAGHGAVRSVYEYKMEIEKQTPILFSLLNRLIFLARCNSFLILSSDYNEFGDGDIYKIRVFNGMDILDNDLEIQKRLSEGQKEHLIRYVYFHNTENNIIVNLYPFVSYMFCKDCKKERFFFYNGVKDSTEITYLSFECGHTINYENAAHFSKRFAAVDIQFP